ncbi:MAG TPA: Fur family transcriptional regulator [Haloplasmataceae bacterium]
MGNLKTLLAQKGLRLTTQRQLVYNMMKNERLPLNAETIYHKLHEQNESINLSTVYRILDLFEAHQIVTKTYFDNKAYYALNEGHKHYLTCLNCQTVVEVDHCPIPELESQIEATTHFLITSHRLDFFGLCPNCQKH